MKANELVLTVEAQSCYRAVGLWSLPHLAILTIRERVVQHASLKTIAPTFEVDRFWQVRISLRKSCKFFLSLHARQKTAAIF